MAVIKHYVTNFRFMQEFCCYKYHWCNGKPIPEINLETGADESGFVELPKCIHLKDGKCDHPQRKFKNKK